MKREAPPLEPPAYPVFVVDHGQDNPRACTARKIARHGLARIVPDAWPKGGLLLDPFAERALSPADQHIGKRGIVVLDCSWHKADPATFAGLRTRNAPRALPFLLAANPIAWGKPFRLSSAEAVAASLAILGDAAGAERMMNLFKWGPQFLILNHEPLAAYAKCQTSVEVVAAQWLFTPKPEGT